MCALVSPAPPPVATKEEAPSEWWPGMLEGGTVATVAGAPAARSVLTGVCSGQAWLRCPGSHLINTHPPWPLRRLHSLCSGRGLRAHAGRAGAFVCCAVPGALPAVLTLHSAPKVTARPHGATAVLGWAWRFGSASRTIGAASAQHSEPA